MSAAAIVAQVVADVAAAGVPATADPARFAAMLAESGVAALVDLPTIELLPVKGSNTRLTIPVRVVAVPGDPNGVAPLLAAAEMVAPLGQRAAAFPEPFQVTADTTAPAYTITLYRKDI